MLTFNLLVLGVKCHNFEVGVDDDVALVDLLALLSNHRVIALHLRHERRSLESFEQDRQARCIKRLISIDANGSGHFVTSLKVTSRVLQLDEDFDTFVDRHLSAQNDIGSVQGILHHLHLVLDSLFRKIDHYFIFIFYSLKL